MKTITPFGIWINGVTLMAAIFQLNVTSDNLNNEATFSYSLYDSNLLLIASGGLIMTGQDYINYSSNQDAWNFGAKALNVTITGDYNPTVKETTSAPIETDTTTAAPTTQPTTPSN